jgi:uncharacterized protein YjdB
VTVVKKTGPGEDPVPVTGIEVWPPTVNLPKGSQTAVIAIISPGNATEKGVVWTSSNPEVATVDQYGRVTAIAPGTALITATTVDGAWSDSCLVTVTTAPEPEKPLYPHNPGEFGISVTITINDWTVVRLKPIVS